MASSQEPSESYSAEEIYELIRKQKMESPSVTTETLTAEQIAEQIEIDKKNLEALLLEERAARQEEIPQEALLWMAVTPEWTLPLAEACSFPCDSQSVTAIFERMAERGFIEVAESPIPEERNPSHTLYSMYDADRADLLKEELNQPEKVNAVRSVVATIGMRIMTSGASVELVPLRTQQWAELAAHATSGGAMASVLDAKVAEAFERNDSESISDWIEVAQPLLGLLEHGLDLDVLETLERAERREELLRREEFDQRHLKLMLRRDEQIEEFRNFMRQQDDAWGLHFLGVGGVGKTMLIRDITINLAAEEKAIAARIDFDYLSADYPSMAPGLLLWAFSEDLRLRAARLRDYPSKAGEAEDLFREANERLVELHQRLRADLRSDWHSAVRDEDFIESIKLYIRAFNAYKPWSVLLILDTCEELARVRPDGSIPSNVEATFAILHALHYGPQVLLDAEEMKSPTRREGVSNLRVIFGGRRLLAGEGKNWSVSSSSLVERPYLRLHQIRGFNLREATEFLQRIVKVPDNLVEPIIKRSPEISKPINIRWTDHQAAADETRFNPYELTLYAGWAKETPPPKPEVIEKATGAQYIELRIIRRLKDKTLESLLPAVALLGQFDEKMLRAMADIDEDEKAFNVAYAKLNSLEWINQRRIILEGETQARTVFYVEPTLRQRLFAYFRVRSDQFEHVRRRAASYLKQITLHEDLSQLDWSYFDSAIRIWELEPDMELAAEWWKQVEARILSERGSDWALNTFEFLTASDEPAFDAQKETEASPGYSLRPAVQATYASILLNSLGSNPHTVQDTSGRGAKRANPSELVDTWRRVIESISRRAPSGDVASLRRRARAGIVAATKYTRALPGAGEVKLLWGEIEALEEQIVDPQIAAAFVDAVDAVIEAAERNLTDDPVGIRKMLRHEKTQDGDASETMPLQLARKIEASLPLWRSRVSETDASLAELAAFSFALAGRAEVLAGSPVSAVNSFLSALQYARQIGTNQASSVWANWVPPDNVSARVRLEFARTLYPRFFSVNQVLDELNKWEESSGTVDDDRLRSLTLRLRSAQLPVILHRADVRQWYRDGFIDSRTSEEDIVPGPSSCEAHRAVPPLFATVAEILAENGKAEQALPLLRHISTNKSQFDEETLRQSERVLVSILRRWRLRDIGESGGNSLENSPGVKDRALLWALDGFDGQKNQKPGPRLSDVPPHGKQDEWIHAIWQARFVREGVGVEEFEVNDFMALFKDREELPRDLPECDFLQVSIWLDALENSLLRKTGGDGRKPLDRQSVFRLLRLWGAAHPYEPEHLLRLYVRSIALYSSAEDIQNDMSHIPSFWELDDLMSNLDQRLGFRRVAMFMLQEAELLSLRLPSHAATLYRLSLRWFELCEDYVGEIITRTALALIEARRLERPGSEQASRLGALIERVKYRYSIVQVPASYSTAINETAESQLPTWETLQEIAANPRDKDLNTLWPMAWQPWLVRVIVCMVCLNLYKQPHRTEAFEALLEWLRTTGFGSIVEGKVRLSAELDEWLDRLLATQKVRGFPRLRAAMDYLLAFSKSLLLVILIPLLSLVSIGYLLFIHGETLRLGESTKNWMLIIFIGICFFLVLGRVLQARRTRKSFYEVFHLTEKLGFLGFILVVAAASLKELGYEYPGKALEYTGLALLLVMLLRIVSLIFRGYLFFLAYVFSQLNIRLEITRAPPAKQPASSASHITVNLKFMMGIFKNLNEQFPLKPIKAEVVATIPASDSYRNMTASIPKTHTDAHARFQRLLPGSRGVETVIQPSEELHGPCWEAIVFPVEKKRAEEKVNFKLLIRRETTNRVARTVSRDGVTNVLCWAESIPANQLAQYGWEPLRVGEADFNVKVERATSLQELTSAPEEIGILHLIGTVKRTNAGLRLRIEKDEPVGVSLEKEEGNRLPARFVRPEDVARYFPSLSICIIQGSPLKRSLPNRESARSEAQLARAFAADVFRQGVPVVLFLPSVDASLSPKVLGEMARAIKGRPRFGTKALLQSLTKARSLIADEAGSDLESALEMAFDACVYLIADWDGRKL